MTQDEIIRMAREAGLGSISENIGFIMFNTAGAKELERFAALVAAYEREKPANLEPVAWMDAIGNIHKQKLQRDWIPLYISTQSVKQKPVVWKNTVDEVRFKEPVNSCQKTTELVDIEAAVLAEREACAKVCENLPTPKDATTLTHIPTLETCAAAIRARDNHASS